MANKDNLRNERHHGWPDWSVWPGHCEHAEDHEELETFRVCGLRTSLCAGPCPSCPYADLARNAEMDAWVAESQRSYSRENNEG